MNGAPVAAHVGRTVREMIPGLFPTVEPYIRRALNGEVIPKVEARGPANTPGQAERTIPLSYQPVFGEAGDVIGISLAVVDLTEL
jgi:PAS fold